MKRYLMVFLAVLLFSAAASAQSESYLCLFSDVDHTTWCANAATIPGNITMYVFQLPIAAGSRAAELQLIYPDDPDLMLMAVQYSSEISITLGELADGITIGFDDCKTGWFLMASQQMITFSTTPWEISIAPHPTSGGPSYAECVGAREKYPAVAWNSLYINYAPGSPECSETAVAETTWGAIKGMYTY